MVKVRTLDTATGRSPPTAVQFTKLEHVMFRIESSRVTMGSARHLYVVCIYGAICLQIQKYFPPDPANLYNYFFFSLEIHLSGRMLILNVLAVLLVVLPSGWSKFYLVETADVAKPNNNPIVTANQAQNDYVIIDSGCGWGDQKICR
jgi:hypothetical protein